MSDLLAHWDFFFKTRSSLNSKIWNVHLCLLSTEASIKLSCMFCSVFTSSVKM